MQNDRAVPPRSPGTFSRLSGFVATVRQPIPSSRAFQVSSAFQVGSKEELDKLLKKLGVDPKKMKVQTYVTEEKKKEDK